MLLIKPTIVISIVTVELLVISLDLKQLVPLILLSASLSTFCRPQFCECINKPCHSAIYDSATSVIADSTTSV